MAVAIRAPAGADDVYVWGHNTWGQLGLGHLDNVPYPEPVDAMRESTVSHVACGGHHLVLLTLQDEVWVAGKNSHAQLGIEETEDRQTQPVLLDTLSGRHITTIACGYDHTVLVTEEGSMWSFGHNANGELGHGEFGDFAHPRRIADFGGSTHVRVVDVASKGYHTLALTADAEVYAWGKNNFGQLGIGTSENAARPTEVVALRGKRCCELACGSYHSVVITRGDEILTFGDNNYGQLGLGDTDCRVLPEAVALLCGRGAGGVSCGFSHTMVALHQEGAVFAFGGNQHGQLGLGHTDDQNRPRRVETLVGMRVLQVVCGYNHTFFWTEGDGGEEAFNDGYGRRFGGRGHHQHHSSGGGGGGNDVHAPQRQAQRGGLLACGANNFGQLGLGEAAMSAAAFEALPIPASSARF